MLLNKENDFSHLSQLTIALVSDTHQEISNDVCDIVSTCDIVIHAGDIGSSEVLEKLQPKLGHIIAVSGNNDKPYLWEFKDWELVNQLPKIQNVLLSGGLLSIEHGHEHDMYMPAHEDLRQAHSDARAVVYGHTHIQVIDKENPQHFVINPGAAGYTRNKGGPSCIVLSISNDDWSYKIHKFSENN